LELEGLYRVSGNKLGVDKLKATLNVRPLMNMLNDLVLHTTYGDPLADGQ
jgi:hypothetical protein